MGCRRSATEMHLLGNMLEHYIRIALVCCGGQACRHCAGPYVVWVRVMAHTVHGTSASTHGAMFMSCARASCQLSIAAF